MIKGRIFYEFLFLLLFLFITSCSDNPDDNQIIEIQSEIVGEIIGAVHQLDEYGLSSHAWGYSESSEVILMDSNRNPIRVIETENEARQEFKFDSLSVGTYYLMAEAPSFKTCKEEFKLEISEEEAIVEIEISLKNKEFSAKINSFQVDSLIGNKLYHSFEVDKDGGKTLGVRLYLSDNSNVNNQNYLESLYNLSAWASANSGQYYTYLEITPELYQHDSIYISAYLVNREADECTGNNGLIYHFPFSEEYVTIGIEK